MVEHEMSLVDAVMAPRFGHPHPGMDVTEIEGDFSEEIFAGLEARTQAVSCDSKGH